MLCERRRVNECCVESDLVAGAARYACTTLVPPSFRPSTTLVPAGTTWCHLEPPCAALVPGCSTLCHLMLPLYRFVAPWYHRCTTLHRLALPLHRFVPYFYHFGPLCTTLVLPVCHLGRPRTRAFACAVSCKLRVPGHVCTGMHDEMGVNQGRAECVIVSCSTAVPSTATPSTPTPSTATPRYFRSLDHLDVLCDSRF